MARSFYLRVFAIPFGAAPRRGLSRTNHPTLFTLRYNILISSFFWILIVSQARGKSKDNLRFSPGKKMFFAAGLRILTGEVKIHEKRDAL